LEKPIKSPVFPLNPRELDQGIGVYFLIVKISLNSQKFSRKNNHKGEEGAHKDA
jgi:hypothetical protein